MQSHRSERLTDNAKRLRRDMTRQERKLWHVYLRNCGVRFYRQRVIGPYIVDFYSAGTGLVIEVDGGQHYDGEAVARDAARDNYLNDLGLQVLRFTNKQVDNEFSAVCDEIGRALMERSST